MKKRIENGQNKILSFFLVLCILFSPFVQGISAVVNAETLKGGAEQNLPATILRIENEKGELIKTPIKFGIFDNWEPDEELIEINSENGLLDLKKIIDNEEIFDDQSFYLIKIKENPNYTIENLSDNEVSLDTIVFKKEVANGSYVVKKFLKDNSQEVINKLVIKTGEMKEASNEETTYKKGQEVTISDIKVVDEKGQAIEDNVKFHTFNKENKSMVDYSTKNGKLQGVKAKVGDRMKIGVAPDSQTKYTMMEKLYGNSKYFNYVWFKVNEKGQAIRFDDKTETDISELKELTLIHKDTLVGTKPTTEKVKKEIQVFDITSHNFVDKDIVRFSITGDGETREIVSENGRVSVELYKDTKYTINLVRTMQNSFKMEGFSFALGNDNVLRTEDKKILEKLNVYQGSYLVRIYVIHKGQFVEEGFDFEIIEDKTDKIQNRTNEGKFLNFDAEMGKSYTIKLKENSKGLVMEPVHITMRIFDKDGLYWPMLDKGKYPVGDDGKLKGLFLNKVGEELDNTIPESNGGCSNNGCEISRDKIKPASIAIKAQDGSSVEGFIFKLFNSSKQRYEDDVKVVNGKVELELFAGNKYFLQLMNDKYSAHNTYIRAYKDGETLVNPKTDKEVKEIEVLKKVETKEPTNRYSQSLQVTYAGKPANDVELEFISENDRFTVKSTNGSIEFTLLEDVTYVVKSLNPKYETQIFPLVLKDKMEWGVNGDKRLFDHSTCNSVQAIVLYDNNEAFAKGSVTCASGRTTIKGMIFNNLELIMDRLDKNDFDALKEKDVDVLDVVLINPFRCERSKIAYGEFEIQRELTNDKTVEKIYYLNGTEKDDLKFTQNGKILNITGVKDLGIKKLVIQYKSENSTESKMSWEKVEGIWYYRDSAKKDIYTNDWAKIDNVWYRFDKDGKMLSDTWFEDNGKWYWLESSGAMSENEWIDVNGNWFWANKDGSIAENEWIDVDGNWFYAKAGGYLADSEWIYVGDKWYYAKSGGYIVMNQNYTVNGTIYSFDENGAIR